jgi:hypothetical protein
LLMCTIVELKIQPLATACARLQRADQFHLLLTSIIPFTDDEYNKLLL